MKLISMTSFIEEQEKIIPSTEHGPVRDWDRIYVQRTISYCRFLRQPLALGMFVPVNEEGKVLEEPVHYKEWLYQYKRGFEHDYEALVQNEYRKAKEKVMFEGFAFFGLNKGEIVGYVKNENIDLVYSFPNHRNYTIEDLCHYKIELTHSALKQIGI